MPRPPRGRVLLGGIPEPVPALELDFSDDWVLLKPETARRFLEPTRLERLELQPERVTVQPGSPVSFTAKGFDQHGLVYPVADPHWAASGGSIDQVGRFVSDQAGFYAVTVEEASRDSESTRRRSLPEVGRLIRPS